MPSCRSSPSSVCRGRPMIVTLTPNPSLDRTVEIDELRRGEVHRATGGRVDPGGKGVNVSRALAAERHRHRRRAARPAAPRAPSSRRCSRRSACRRCRCRSAGRCAATSPSPSRTAPRPSSTRPGPSSAGRGRGRRAHGGRAGGRARAGWSGPAACRAGSASTSTPGSPPRCATATPRCASTRAGRRWPPPCDAGPDLIKPNAEELAELVGRPLARLADVVEAAERGPQARRGDRARQPRG